MDMLPGALLSQMGTEVVWDQAVEGKQQKTSVQRLHVVGVTATRDSRYQWLQQSWFRTGEAIGC